MISSNGGFLFGQESSIEIGSVGLNLAIHFGSIRENRTGNNPELFTVKTFRIGRDDVRRESAEWTL